MRAEPAAIAWEWLRRDDGYRLAATGARCRVDPNDERRIASAPEAARWGLHAFADPALPATAARPVWRRDVFPRVLAASAEAAGPPEEQFDLARFAPIAT